MAGSNNLYEMPEPDAAQLKSDAGGSERLQGTAGAAFTQRLASKMRAGLDKI